MRYQSINQLSEFTGIDRRTIKKRLADVKVHSTEGRAQLYDCHEALPRLYSNGSSSGSIQQQMENESLKLERAKAEKAVMEVNQLRGELIPIEEVAQTVSKEYAYVRSKVRTLESKLAIPMSRLSDPQDCATRIRQEVDECLVELSADVKYEQQRATIDIAREASSGMSSDGVEAVPATERS